MARTRDPLADTALVAVFAALMAVFSAFVPGIAVGPAPITLQTLAVALIGLILGPVRGLAAVLLYLVVGLAGLPVFAQGAAGPGILASASIGYLLSFPVAAWLIGLGAGLCLRGARRRLAAKLTAVTWAVSLLVIHPAGVVGLMVNAGMGLGAAALYDLRFWPGDLIKGVLAGLIAAVVHRAFPALAARPARGNRPSAAASATVGPSASGAQPSVPAGPSAPGAQPAVPAPLFDPSSGVIAPPPDTVAPPSATVGPSASGAQPVAPSTTVGSSSVPSRPAPVGSSSAPSVPPGSVASSVAPALPSDPPSTPAGP
ncbi:MAG: biotin transporter BioY [Propionibacteriaceae bacterium]|jgi:biotin transport system substrate-specific component|nr:biotin transporter BioY [Propionibacteriaceae bacterium]